MTKMALSLALFAILTGCSGADSPSIGSGPSGPGASSNTGNPPGASSSGGPSLPASDAGAAQRDAGGTPPPPPPPDAAPACPDLSGTWTGSLDGTVTGQLQGTVTGSTSLVMVPSANPGDYDLQSGSQLNLQMDVGLGSTPITQPVSGTVKCGVLDSAQDVQVLGKTVHATAKCTFNGANGCNGTWSAVSADNSGQASGTFTAKKQ